ncbi:hypothetical protein MLD38_036500 [Melastoma candidum]|uniref:Uncharacterized protein n=1 Tax=Melastoma candidum TaxID=119954 RepID=A0ACB9LKU7_9MYRT|nr:hypothetical protein MLD38_036500 [Melastoma candidum]
MAAKTRILVIGGTGYIGRFIVEASARAGHPTTVLVRESTLSDPAKSATIESFRSLGIDLVHGDLYDQQSLEKAIEEVDVIISTVGNAQLADQDRIIAAIKKSGNIKRFLPSEFATNVDRTRSVEPLRSALEIKSRIRQSIEAENIPHTYVYSNCFGSYSLSTFLQHGATGPPRDRVIIFGDGNPKAVFNQEEDIATYTIKVVDDPRTLNKVVDIRPTLNTYSFNDLVSLWEKKIGKTLERVHIPIDQVLRNIEEASFPLNLMFSILHAVFVLGLQANSEIKESFVEASALYPDVKYKTVDEYLDQFV